MTIANSKLHFIGIGGIGMCGLAELLHRMGAQVSGSDLASNSQTENLKKLGVKVYKGHSSENIDADVDVVVYSSAVKQDNFEFIYAKEHGIPLIPRAEALAEIMLLKKGIAIAGTHGKTTTTSLTSSVLLEAGLDPTIFVGGIVDKLKSTAQLGEGEWLVAEADESDGSFLKLSPFLSVITNIDTDHLDYYGSFEAIQKAFYDFALKVPFYGKVLVFGDDPKNKELFAGFPKKILFYGFNEDNDYRLTSIEDRFSIACPLGEVIEFTPPLPGRHNALNCAAAFAVADTLGIAKEKIVSGLESFSGVARRSQYKGITTNSVKIYDDYGHHPTELKAVLSAFKGKAENRLVALFEPHRYSRTKDCWSGFIQSFGDVDVLLLIDIYPAGEKPIEGIHSKRLCDEIQHSHKHYISFGTASIQDAEDLIQNHAPFLQQVRALLQPGDVVLTLGAGKVYRVGEALLGLK